MKTVLLAGVAAAALALASMADVTYTLTNQTWTGFNFTEAALAGSLTGTLTGASIDVTLNASVDVTFANDLCIYVARSPLVLPNGGLLQCGGLHNFSVAQRYYWPNGNSSAVGTTSIGTITLIGVTESIPAPGALALLGMVGVVGSRRQRS